jgi:hypothetical protein
MGSEGLGVVVIANYFTSRWIFRIITLVSLEMYLEAAITCFRRNSYKGRLPQFVLSLPL